MADIIGLLCILIISGIILACFLRDDFEDEKDLKYKDTIMRWNRQALAELEKVSAKPYVKREKQLHLI